MAGRCPYARDPQQGLQGEKVLTTTAGIPIANVDRSLTAGPRGPMLLQDVVYLETMASFVREKITERAVHAHGAGAFGEFEVTHDITKYCKARVFEKIGKKTEIAIRFSTTNGEKGTSDFIREPRGFAIKFYTEDGNWDLVGNHSPVFFIRDPILFPSLSHAQKRNPQTNLKDPNALWDFLSLRPESLHEATMIFSDHGLPDGFRHMDGFGIHAFRLVNARGEAVFAKFTYKTNQGFKYLTNKQAQAMAGVNPDYAVKDLFDAICRGDFPSWTLFIQVMTEEVAKNLPFNPFDATKLWPEDKFPFLPVGRLTLNRNPLNFFADMEMIAFCPSNMVPGIEPSPDKLLQGRLLAYGDALRYRLGVNFNQIPVNMPKHRIPATYHRDGLMRMFDNEGNSPNYFPNSFGGIEGSDKYLTSPYRVFGDVSRYEDDQQDDVSQARDYYLNKLKFEERQRLCENLAESLAGAQPFIQKRTVQRLNDIHPDYGA
ncbi:catalase-like, partial [Gastrophryne carolinensis]